ncbi:unnamed protein product, partial [Owenia fusiformis]
EHVPCSKLAFLPTLFIFSWQKAFNVPFGAVAVSLLFLKMFICDVASNLAITDIFTLTLEIPSSVYRGKEMLGIKDSFQKYVVCEKCHHSYEIDNNLTLRQDGSRVS